MEAIPEEVERFLVGNIDSIDQLEILRVLGHQPGREWGAAELAKEVQVGERALGAHLAALHSRGLVASTPMARTCSGCTARGRRSWKAWSTASFRFTRSVR